MGSIQSLLDFGFGAMLCFGAPEDYTMSRETMPPEPRVPWWRRRLPDALTVVLCLLLWWAFFPGLMSNDSVVQYGEALTGEYRDWHPPFMSILLHFVLILGGGLGTLMLAQCLAGAFGVRALVRSALAFFQGDRVPAERAAWLSLGVLLLLLVPVTPLACYLMTFWKDVWAMAFLLWMAALLLNLHRRGPAPGRLLAVAGLAAALGLVRHNAVAVLPLIGVVVWMAVRPRLGRPAAVAWAAAPLALYLVAGPLIDRGFAVRKLHPESQVMVLDLVGLCAADRAACPRRLPWTWSHVLDAGALAAYRPGDVGFIYWDQPPHVDPSMGDDYPRLRAEYLAAFRERPGLFARVKLNAFKPLLGRWRTEYFIHDSIVWNPYRLTLRDTALAPLRRSLTTTASRVAWNAGLRWISGVHLVWLLVDAAWVAGLLAAWLRTREERYGFLAAVLLIPLAYYFSYLAAAPGHDFRYMYPATLLVQCVTVSWALGAWAARGPARRRSTPPGPRRAPDRDGPPPPRP
jgi:MFS family permease